MRLYFRWKLFLGFFGFAVFVAGLLAILMLLQLSSAGAEGRLFLPRLRPFILWTLASLGLISIPPALWIASRLNRPIRLLHEAMQQVAGGRLDTRIPPTRTYDEFEILIENFNRMVAELAERAELLAEREQFVETRVQLGIAREIQRSLLPAGPPVLGHFDIAGASHSADEVGGDYFDYLPMQNGRLGVVVSDVAGLGIGPALVMAATRSCLRSLAAAGYGLEEILERTNGTLHESTPDNCFVTLALAEIDPASRRLRYVNCGHSSGYLLDSAGAVKARLTSTVPPLGCMQDFAVGKVEELPFGTGDVLVLMTDGVTEAESPDKRFFGDRRALEVVRAHLHAPATRIVDAVHQAARAFCEAEGAQDDITSVVVKVGGEPKAAGGLTYQAGL
jgi:sigma-B regulation protein RsbU (phosphoserine phosphatase)